MKGASTEPDLTFQWPAEKGFSFVLFVCVAGSLLAHAATFVLFHVVYPQRVTIPQPAPQVSLLTPSSPENVALLRWIEAEDPALIAAGNPVLPPTLTEVGYRPSFATPRTAPLGAPAEEPQEVRFPPAIDRLTTIKDRSHAGPKSRPPPVTPTLIQFTGPLASRPLVENPPLDVALRSATAINPTILLIGVDQHGEVRYQFLQQTSGDTPFDDLAVAQLQRLRFAKSDAEMTWAYAAFVWGGEVYVETTNAAPPHPGAP